MSKWTQIKNNLSHYYPLIFFLIVVMTFLLGLLTASIMEKRVETLQIFHPTGSIKEVESKNEVWGRYYPLQYESYLKTAESNFKSKHNSNQLTDMLKEDPNLIILWAGYGFSKDYNQPRGHFYAVTDVRNTLRTGAPKGPNDGPSPNTCWTCKSPDVPRVMKDVGANEFYKGKWASRGHQIHNPIGCADCHDPETMSLHITRPALLEALTKMGKDVNKISHQEMRSLVCAQCHVEYYFQKEDNKLVFPWTNGLSAEEMEKYYDGIEFSDWVHQLSKTPLLKAQHPDYELWTTGIHAKRGVSCVDCHMPYVSQGGMKYTDHHAQSPLNSINRSCQVCHRQSEEELRQNVYSKQDSVFELRMEAEKVLVRAHIEAKLAWDKGATEEEMKSVLKFIRQSQWRWDFAVASHGASFHSSLDASRLLGHSVIKGQEARRLLVGILNRHGVIGEVPLPDISTKEKAQSYIGLNMDQLQLEKKEFKETVIPVWDKSR